MTPFAWTSKSAPANDEGPAPINEVPPFILPFDGHRPVLICGHTFSGKEAFVSHLLTGGRGARPVDVIDPMAKSNYIFGARPVNLVRPDLSVSEGEFFVRAAEVVQAAVAVEGAAVVIDEFLLMTESYENPLAEQEAFAYVLDEALTAARRNRVRILMVTSKVPSKAQMARFGCRFFIGPMMPMDWVMMFGRQQPAVESLNRPGTGVMYLDRDFSAIEFPLTAPKPVEEPKAKRAFGFGKKSDAEAEKTVDPKAKPKGDTKAEKTAADQQPA